MMIPNLSGLHSSHFKMPNATHGLLLDDLVTCENFRAIQLFTPAIAKKNPFIEYFEVLASKMELAKISGRIHT